MTLPTTARGKVPGYSELYCDISGITGCKTNTVYDPNRTDHYMMNYIEIKYGRPIDSNLFG